MGEVLDPRDVSEGLKKIWPLAKVTISPASYQPTSSYLNFTVSEMYEAPERNIGTLIALAKLLNTDRYRFSDFSSEGCETCDYGSSYGFSITIYKENIGQWDAPGIKEFILT
jgi:hypothetical protein